LEQAPGVFVPHSTHTQFWLRNDPQAFEPVAFRRQPTCTLSQWSHTFSCTLLCIVANCGTRLCPASSWKMSCVNLGRFGAWLHFFIYEYLEGTGWLRSCSYFLYPTLSTWQEGYTYKLTPLLAFPLIQVRATAWSACVAQPGTLGTTRWSFAHFVLIKNLLQSNHNKYNQAAL
jgi:hypothetical protein